jgi:membrane fusion protein (multidrug efflux system)
MSAASKQKTMILGAVILALAVIVAGAGGLKKKTAPAAVPATAVEVEVVQVGQRDVPIYGEWIGALDGMVNADVKAQVQGYLITRDYPEGSYVKKGQLLFEIDPKPFQATLDQANAQLSQTRGQLQQATGQFGQAQAQLAQAKANQVKTQMDVDRYTPLAKQGVIPQESLDNAVQANLAAQAQVSAFSAAVETASAGIATARASVQSAEAAAKNAQLNLEFTKVTSPIDGVAGIALAQIGNLVGPSGGVLTTVSTVDPIKAYFTVTEQEYLNYARQNPTEKERRAAQQQLELELILADGTTYPQKGKFFAADRSVDEKTGAIRLAGVFPNPGNVLRPGQYGRVRAATALRQGALMVPQRAVSEMQGIYQVAVVGKDNIVDMRPVKVGERIESMWIITQGLKAGESVVTEGIQKVRPGAKVIPRAFIATGPARNQ